VDCTAEEVDQIEAGIREAFNDPAGVKDRLEASLALGLDRLKLYEAGLERLLRER
jgi:hypothetical protein